MNKKFLCMMGSLLSVCVALERSDSGYEDMPPLENEKGGIVVASNPCPSTSPTTQQELVAAASLTIVSSSNTAQLLAEAETQAALRTISGHLLSPKITPEIVKALSAQSNHGVVPEITNAKKTKEAIQAAEAYCDAGNHPINAVCALFDRIPATKEWENVLKIAQWIEPRDVLYRCFLPDALAQKMIELNDATACIKIGEFMYQALYCRWNFSQKPFFHDATLPAKIMELSCWKDRILPPTLKAMLVIKGR